MKKQCIIVTKDFITKGEVRKNVASKAWNGIKSAGQWVGEKVDKYVVQPVKKLYNNTIKPYVDKAVQVYNDVKEEIKQTEFYQTVERKVEAARQVVVKKLCEGKEKLQKFADDVKEATGIDLAKVAKTVALVGGAALADWTNCSSI